eukprot:gene1911-467_t
MDLLTPSDHFWVFLGVDEGVHVVHKLLRHRRSESGLLQKTSKVQYQYQIEVKNNKPQPVECVVWDQLPISEDKKISVVMDSITPEGVEMKKNEHNYVEWYVQLAAGAKQIIPFGFAVEYPHGTSIDGLDG